MTTAIVTLADAKPYTNIPLADTTHDAELQTFIDAASDVVENIVGPVRAAGPFTEWHDGMCDTILLRRHPVASIASVTEYQGTASFVLTSQSPDAGVPLDAFGYFADLDVGTIQRTAYGMPSWFAAVPWWTARTPAWYTATAMVGHGTGRVKVVYSVGRATVLAHIFQGTLELIRVNYQGTQQGGRPDIRGASEAEPGQVVLGFFVPKRVREMLLPTQQPYGFR